MKRLTIILCVLLIVGHLLTELGSVLYLINRPKSWRIDPFLSPWYEFPGGQGIDVYWWIKWVTDDLLWCITFFTLAKVSYQFSFRLFLVACIFFLYHVIDSFMLWWNYKTSYWLYWVMIAAVILTIISLFMPEKKQAIIKSLK
jgi:hypothetical protein